MQIAHQSILSLDFTSILKRIKGMLVRNYGIKYSPKRRLQLRRYQISLFSSGKLVYVRTRLIAGSLSQHLPAWKGLNVD